MAIAVSWGSSCSEGCRAVAAGSVGVVVVVCAYGTAAAGVDAGATDSAAGAGDAWDHLGGRRRRKRRRRRRRRRKRRRRRRTNRKGGGDDDKEDEKSGLGDILW